MGSSIDIPSEKEREGRELVEEEYIKSLANECRCYRIYKLGSKGEGGWSHYKPINYPEEEAQIPKSSWDYAVLVYDRGKVVNVDGLWEKSPLVPRKKKGLLRILFSELFGESDRQVGEREVAGRGETQTCSVCGQSKRSRIWGGCFSGHLICEDCLLRARMLPIIPGRELKCPICGQPLF